MTPKSQTPVQPASQGQTLARRPVFLGRVIDVGVETVRLPNGRECDLEIIRHPGGAAAVALDGEGRVCLLRQYRHAGSGWLWELPAGKLDPGEDPFFTARRELIEEAGVEAGTWRPLGRMLSSPGVFTEVIHLYLGQDLTARPLAHEGDEVIEVHWLPLDQALAWCLDGAIVDAKTLIGLFRAAAVLGQPWPRPAL
jgi:8-oxo-dGTP pyrophosphatase MutT (NUDIX family)